MPVPIFIQTVASGLCYPSVLPQSDIAQATWCPSTPNWIPESGCICEVTSHGPGVPSQVSGSTECSVSRGWGGELICGEAASTCSLCGLPPRAKVSEAAFQAQISEAALRLGRHILGTKTVSPCVVESAIAQQQTQQLSFQFNKSRLLWLV